MGIPPPAIIMPVCPVARNVLGNPRFFNALANARAVYFFPTQQSVPTVSKRLPVRRWPLARGIFSGATRTSISCCRAARAARDSAGSPSKFWCNPLTILSPLASASTNGEIQDGASAPPKGATPIKTLFAPAATAAAGVISGSPRSTVQPGRRHCPTHRSGCQSRSPTAVLASNGLVISPKKSK